MRVLHATLFAAFAALALTGCNHALKNTQLSEYCSNEKNADTDLCALNGEFTKDRQAIATAQSTANDAKSAAGKAQSTADSAQTAANEANAKVVNCTTNTLRKTQTGSCEAGYTLVGCTQTHYTTRAGGMAILRSIDNTECKYNARVLEVQVRCCQVGAPGAVAASTPAAPASTPRPTT
jgi:hypothetical protein